MPVKITNHFHSINAHFSRRKIHTFCEWLLKELDISSYGLSILLTNDEGIHYFNHHYRKKDSATNVLSFPFGDGLNENFSSIPVLELGDIIVSIETAIKEAKQYNLLLMDRISWLVTHGLLHLLGYDHEISEQKAEKMFAKEAELLKKFKKYRSRKMTHLAINVDHVATIRQARGTKEPDPVTAAAICELAGASGIVVHLREDRRHMQDHDIYLLRKTVKTKLNLEMGANKDIIEIALDVVPDMITLVPEKRQELTTEGGLDVIAQKKKLAKVIKKFEKSGIPVSIFIDPDHDQIKASHDIGATFVEIHTGRYCDALTEENRDHEFHLIASAADEAYQLGLTVFGGHGLDYQNTAQIAALGTFEELSIGHAIISRSIFTGLDQAVRDMLTIIKTAQLDF
jgi:pyridoxine 5-phosphate synthase